VPLTARGVQLDVVGREITGRPVPGRPRRAYGPYLRALPALALLSVVMVPAALTTRDAFRTVGGHGWANFRAVFADPGARHALRNSLVWLLVAVLLVALGLGVALATRRVSRLWELFWRALVFPFGVAALVSGVAFRIIFDPTPQRGVVTRLATGLTGGSPVWLSPGLIWVVLVSAFAWTWLGYAVSLLRAGLDTIPEDLVRAVAVEGVPGWRRLLTVELPLLRTVIGVVGLTLMVAAVRLFDLVLIVAPGSVQDDADVLGLHWWRAPGGAGRSAALAVLLFAIVALVAVAGLRNLRRPWALPAASRRADRGGRAERAGWDGRGGSVRRDSGTGRHRATPRASRLGIAVGVPLILLWALPALMLLATALHEPTAAATGGWWSPAGLGLGSVAEVFRVGLGQALLVTAFVAVVATVLVLAVGSLTAHLVTWGGLPHWLGRAAMTAFVILSVMPVQMYADPLRHALARVWLGDTPLALGVVHAAAGLPFAVLLLRATFAAVPPDVVAAGLHDTRWQAIRRLGEKLRPALVAVAVLESVLVWNDFIVGLLVSGAGSTPQSLVLSGLAKQFASSAGPVAAAAVLSSLVPVVLLLAAWPTVVRGLTVGAKP
jgi:alpha-glucoside transport system permease protein